MAGLGHSHGIELLEAVFHLASGTASAVEADLQEWLAALAKLIDECRDLPDLSRPDDEVDMGRTLEDPRTILLGHTADHANDLVGASVLHVLETSQGAVHLVLGMLPARCTC